MKTLEKNKLRIFNIIFGYSLFFISFIYFDLLCLIPILSINSLSILFFAVPKKEQKFTYDESNKSRYVLISIILIEFFFSYILRVFFEDIYYLGTLKVADVELCGSFVVYVEFLIIIIYYLTNSHQNKIFKFSNKIVLFSIIILLPFFIYDFSSIIQDIVNDSSYLLCNNFFEDFFRAFILAGLLEELLYRYVIFEELKKITSAKKAVFLQGIIFMMVHSQRWIMLFTKFELYILLNLVVLFIFGVISALLRERTGSLVPSILLHGSLNNGVYSLLGFILKLF